MNRLSVHWMTTLAALVALPIAAAAQTSQPAAVLSIAGQPEQVPLVTMNGKSYVDIDSLARIVHASLRFQGNQTILTLPAQTNGTEAQNEENKVPHLSEGFLTAEIEALTQIREWRAALVNAVQNNYPVTQNWIAGLRRSADAKLDLAIAAATTVPDQKAVELLRNEFSNMDAMTSGFLAMQTKANYISPDSFNNNPQDQKILACERALVSMAATKQFEDEASCH